MNKLILTFLTAASINTINASEGNFSSDGMTTTQFVPQTETLQFDTEQAVTRLTQEAQKLLDSGVENLPKARAFLKDVEMNIRKINSIETINKVTEVVHKLADEANRIASSQEAQQLIEEATCVLVKINETFDQTREDLKPALQNLERELKRLEEQSKNNLKKLEDAVQPLKKEANNLLGRLGIKGIRF
jgi:DNA repair ATPase RecN